MQPIFKAFLFDLNGTMVDDMTYHTQAWYAVLNEDLGAGLSMEAIEKEMYGKNEELLVRIFGAHYFSDAAIKKLSAAKEQYYQAAFRPQLRLIDGLDAFLQAAKACGKHMAVASAAISANIDFVVDNLHIRSYFDAFISAGDVARSKPDPETFLKAAARLHVDPKQCIVFEDAPKGVEAAQNAGMHAVVITTGHAPQDFAAYNNVLFFAKDYNAPELRQLLQVATNV